MRKLLAGIFVCMALALFMVGCAGQKREIKGLGPFTPVDLGAKVKKGELAQKVDSFLIILDISGSMREPYKGSMKLDRALAFTSRLSATIPEVNLTGALRSFGHIKAVTREETNLLYGPTEYVKADFEAALNRITFPRGESMLEAAVKAAGKDLTNVPGKIALIIVSDGKDMGDASLRAVESLAGSYGGRICFYTVLVGNDKAGKKLLEKIPQVAGCGFSINADKAMSPQGMAGFVQRVFFATRQVRKIEKDSDGDGVIDSLDICPNTPSGVNVDIRGCPLDSDGDGVYDYMDRCPDTPKAVRVNELGCPFDSDGDGVYNYMDHCPKTPIGVHVDRWGCPFDSDGDGVYDYMDQCPGTPKGVTVNEKGCCILKGLNFDVNKWDIKPRYYPLLDKIVAILKKNPEMKLEIQGHTDIAGSDAHNMKLSKKRAEAVKAYLIKKGIAPDRLFSKGFGYHRPITTNDTPEGRAKNRRVQLKFIK